jgi:hypothetical protein
VKKSPRNFSCRLFFGRFFKQSIDDLNHLVVHDAIL